MLKRFKESKYEREENIQKKTTEKRKRKQQGITKQIIPSEKEISLLQNY